MTDIQLSSIDEEMLDTVLAKDVEFAGRMEFKKPLMVKGRVSGSICTESDLFIAEGADVQADIQAANVVLRGRVRGNVRASRRVEIYASAVLEGDVTAPEVEMETGCRVYGICSSGRKA